MDVIKVNKLGTAERVSLSREQLIKDANLHARDFLDLQTGGRANTRIVPLASSIVVSLSHIKVNFHETQNAYLP